MAFETDLAFLNDELIPNIFEGRVTVSDLSPDPTDITLRGQIYSADNLERAGIEQKRAGNYEESIEAYIVIAREDLRQNNKIHVWLLLNLYKVLVCANQFYLSYALAKGTKEYIEKNKGKENPIYVNRYRPLFDSYVSSLHMMAITNKTTIDRGQVMSFAANCSGSFSYQMVITDETELLRQFNAILTFVKPAPKSSLPSAGRKKTIRITGTEKEVCFGRYYIHSKNKLEPIEWIVIGKTQDKLVLLSKYCLEQKIFSRLTFDGTPVLWSNCSLRAWLNKEFFEMAFNEEEREYMVKNEVRPDSNPQMPRINQGETTYDYVYLLSCKEQENLRSRNEKIGIPTPYLLKKFNWANPGKGYCNYWLRTIVDFPMPMATLVLNDGSLYGSAGEILYTGGMVNGTNTDNGVRPVICLDLKALTEAKGDSDENLEQSSEDGKPEDHEFFKTESEYKNYCVGDIVNIGSCPQSRIPDSSPIAFACEPVEWVIISIEGNRATLLSKKVISSSCYDEIPDYMGSWVGVPSLFYTLFGPISISEEMLISLARTSSSTDEHLPLKRFRFVLRSKEAHSFLDLPTKDLIEKLPKYICKTENTDFATDCTGCYQTKTIKGDEQYVVSLKGLLRPDQKGVVFGFRPILRIDLDAIDECLKEEAERKRAQKVAEAKARKEQERKEKEDQEERERREAEKRAELAATVITVPEGVEVVTPELVLRFPNASRMILSSTVRRIEPQVLSCSPKLLNIDVVPENPALKSCEGLLCDNKGMLLICPPGRTGRLILSKPIIGISYHAFAMCKGVQQIACGVSIERIDTGAFADCSAKRVLFRGKVSHADFRAFAYFSDPSVQIAFTQRASLFGLPKGFNRWAFDDFSGKVRWHLTSESSIQSFLNGE